MTLDTAMEQGRDARDAGMAQALDHANNVVSDWGDQATNYLQRYAQQNRVFSGWMVTKAADLDAAFPSPPTKKSWGAVFTKAQRDRVICKLRYEADPNRHNNPVPVYESLVYVERAA